MRALSRCVLIAVLIVGLLNIPAFGADEKPLGLVMQAENAHIGNANVGIGTTIFPGDILATEAGGTLRLNLGAVSYTHLPSIRISCARGVRRAAKSVKRRRLL